MTPISKGAEFYLLKLLERAVSGSRPTPLYNYYDGLQELTHELQDAGYVVVREFMDDEYGCILRNGFLFFHGTGKLYSEDEIKLAALFPPELDDKSANTAFKESMYRIFPEELTHPDDRLED